MGVQMASQDSETLWVPGRALDLELGAWNLILGLLLLGTQCVSQASSHFLGNTAEACLRLQGEIV